MSSVERWLIEEGPACAGLGDLIRQFTKRLHAAGAHVDRAFLGPLVMHPQVAGLVVIYDRVADELREASLSHEQYEYLQAQRGTPMAHVIAEKTPLRASLGQGEDHGMVDLIQLREKGFTDFLALPVVVGGHLRAGLTLTTRAPEGFSDADLELIHDANRALGPISMLYIQRFEQGSLLKAYLGKDAGTRVQRGQVRRGDGETLTAAICFFDMRGFTHLSSVHPRPVVLELINAVFSVLVRSVEERGGTVLKFMGDGMLAVFLGDASEACRLALEAARATQDGVSTLNEARRAEDRPVTGVGIGLHHGDVMYGNIGAPGRLDFTVIGAAVNVAARVEALCSRLGENILATDTFVAQVSESFVSQGSHALKGVDDPVEVFAPQR